jgi:putative ABC transport system ATP-binding protein
MSESLSAEDVTVSYGAVVALRSVSVSVAPGSLLAVTGPSGAGKSSLLWALGAALRPGSGRVTLGSVALVSRAQAASLGVVLVPQGNGLASSLTCLENVVVPLLAAGVAAPSAFARADAALALVGLESHGSHLVEELSGGQQQRAALARAFAAQPAVLLADEPTSELDAASRDRVLAALRAEASRGAAVVMATHDPEAAAFADASFALAH